MLAGAEAHHTRWPATLFRSGDQDCLDAGIGFRPGLRQTEGFVSSVLKLIGLDLAVPDHTTLSRRASKPRALKKRQVFRLPDTGFVHVLVDSTGLQIYGASHWLEEKHGAKSGRGWRKLHLALDVDSGDIIAHVMTDQDAGDASQVGPSPGHSPDAAVVIPPRQCDRTARRRSPPVKETATLRR